MLVSDLTDVYVRGLCCHPESPNVTALNLSNGHVLMLELNDKNEININSSLTSGSAVHSSMYSTFKGPKYDPMRELSVLPLKSNI